MKTKRRKTAGIIFLLVMLSAAGMTAQAAPGDIAGDIYETNISTQFCGYDIPAFAARRQNTDCSGRFGTVWVHRIL